MAFPCSALFRRSHSLPNWQFDIPSAQREEVGWPTKRADTYHGAAHEHFLPPLYPIPWPVRLPADARPTAPVFECLVLEVRFEFFCRLLDDIRVRYPSIPLARYQAPGQYEARNRHGDRI